MSLGAIANVTTSLHSNKIILLLSLIKQLYFGTASSSFSWKVDITVLTGMLKLKSKNNLLKFPSNSN